MEPGPAKLPDLSQIQAAAIDGYSVDPDGLTLRLWIKGRVDAVGPVRVFLAEGKREVQVVVVPTPPEYKHGYVGTTSEADMQADVADVVAHLEAPLGSRGIIDAANRKRVKPLPQWILDRRAAYPAPALRPVGSGESNHPLTFRGEL